MMPVTAGYPLGAPYSRALHPPRRALRTALVAALAGLVIVSAAAILIGALP